MGTAHEDSGITQSSQVALPGLFIASLERHIGATIPYYRDICPQLKVVARGNRGTPVAEYPMSSLISQRLSQDDRSRRLKEPAATNTDDCVLRTRWSVSDCGHERYLEAVQRKEVGKKSGRLIFTLNTAPKADWCYASWCCDVFLGNMVFKISLNSLPV